MASVAHNEPMPINDLTPRQSAVLQWVSDGCPAGPEVSPTYKTTARSLAGRDLVNVKGSGKTWTAEITHRGQRVLAGEEPLRKPKRKPRPASGSAAATPNAPSKTTPEPRETVATRAREAVAKVEASERNWADIRVESAEEASKQYRAVDRFLRGKGKDILPAHKEFAFDWHSDDWRPDSPATVTVALIDADIWRTADPEPVLSGAKPVRKYHPEAVALVKSTRFSQSKTATRAKRVLHVLFTEAEARGWRIETRMETGRHRKRQHGAKVVVAEHQNYDVKVKEQTRRVERPPTRYELERYQSSLHRDPKTKMRKYYDHVPTGLIAVGFGLTTREDTEGDPHHLNTAVKELMAAINHRERWLDVVVERRQLAEERERRRLAKAADLAEAEFQEQRRYETLLARATSWKKRLVVEEYLSELECVPEAQEWLSWARQYLDRCSVHGDVSLPKEAVFNAREHWEKVLAFEQTLPEDEKEW